MTDGNATNRWHRPTLAYAWFMLVSFTGLSSYINAAYAITTDSPVVFHAAVPVVVLLTAFFAELTVLSRAHGWARWVALTGLFASFVVVLIASYLAIREMVLIWNPGAPEWVNSALAGIPDVVMIMAGTTVLSLRSKGTKAVANVRGPSRWSRIAGNVGDRIEAATAPSRSVPEGFANAPTNGPTDASRTSDEAFTNASAEPQTEAHEGRRGGSTKASAKAPAKAEVDPRYREVAEWMVTEKIVRGKSAHDYSAIIGAINDGQTNNSMRSDGLGSDSTLTAVRTALRRYQAAQPDRALAAV